MVQSRYTSLYLDSQVTEMYIIFMAPEASYKGRTISYLGGGGSFCWLDFFALTKTIFLGAVNFKQAFSLKNGFQICRMPVPYLYVTIICWSTYFSSISSTNFVFCPHFQQTSFSTFMATSFFSISYSYRYLMVSP